MNGNVYRETGRGNQVLECDGFAISFNPDPWMGSGYLGMFAADTSDGETAVVANGNYFILNGDYRTEYAELVGNGLAACLNFFLDRPRRVSSWSNSVADAVALVAEMTNGGAA